jgi:hypothetical protein
MADEQELAGPLVGGLQIVIDGLPGLIAQFNLTGRPVFFCRTVARSALKAHGVAYVLLFGQGSRENMRRFAETVMPGFA